MKYILSLLLTITCAAPAAARDLKPYFAETAQYWQVPQAWLEAIAEVESGGKPWSLNVAGQSFRFDSKEAALSAAQKALTGGKSFDTGIMQVNNFWLKKYGIDLETAFDPLANIYLGGFILRQEIERLGLNAKAIGAYHSPNPDKARVYADKVLTAIESRKGKPAAAKPGEKSRQAVSPAGPANKNTALTPMTLKGNGGNSMKIIDRR